MLNVCSSLGIECRAARLNSLDLGRSEGLAVEARRKLVAVKEDALGGGNGPKVRAGRPADTTSVGLDGLAKRAELLGVVAICAEGRVGGAAGE